MYKEQIKHTMEYVLDIKALAVSIFSAIMAFLYPISGDLYSMLLLFGGNFIFGLIAEYSNGGNWKKEKFWQAIKEALIFFAIVFFIYGIGYVKEQMDVAQQCVSFVSWSLIYYYGTNIARNLKETFPKESTAYMCAAWLYYILSVEFIKNMPYLRNFLKGETPIEAVEKEEEKEKEKEDNPDKPKHDKDKKRNKRKNEIDEKYGPEEI